MSVSTFAISFYIISGLKCASRSAKAKSSRPPTLWCRFPKTGSWNPSDEDAAVVVSRWAATGRLSGRVGWRTLRWSAWRAGTAISKSAPVSPRQVIFRKKILKKKTWEKNPRILCGVMPSRQCCGSATFGCRSGFGSDFLFWWRTGCGSGSCLKRGRVENLKIW